MEDKVKGEVKEQKDLKHYLVQALILLAVVALGLLVVNQALEYRYRSVFLQTPCEVCKNLNKNYSKCIDGCFTVSHTTFLSPDGDYRDSYGKCYDLNSKEIKCKSNNSFIIP